MPQHPTSQRASTDPYIAQAILLRTQAVPAHNDNQSTPLSSGQSLLHSGQPLYMSDKLGQALPCTSSRAYLQKSCQRVSQLSHLHDSRTLQPFFLQLSLTSRLASHADHFRAPCTTKAFRKSRQLALFFLSRAVPVRTSPIRPACCLHLHRLLQERKD